MELQHVTEEDRQKVLDLYKEVEQGMTETIERMRPHLRAKILIIPFAGGRAVYDRREDRVTKIKSSKLINPECMEWKNVDVEPIYEYFEVML
jgi:hypothetical protein